MSVDYRHDYIELYSISGGNAIGDPDLRGIHLNGERPLDSRTTRDFTLYVFDSNGNVISTTRYDLYLGVQAGNLNDANRLVATLNALPVGTPFGIVTWDEPSQGHYQNWAGVDYNPLIDAMVRAGADRSLYARPWRQWCAYMLVGKIGEPAYFEKLDETPRPDTAPVYGNGFIYQAFSIINGEFKGDKYQNKFLALIGTLWKEGQRIACKVSGTWKFGRAIFVKKNGQWKRIYLSNAFQVMSLGKSQQVIPPRYAGMYMNGLALTPPNRSYSLVQFNDIGEAISANGYDIFFDGNNGGTQYATKMINDLNVMPEGRLFVIYTYDEPSRGHLHPDLVTAMLRVGATNAIYGQPMNYRGAYMLIGKVGSPNYFEKYVGDKVGDDADESSGDPNSAIYQLFTIQEGNILFMDQNWSWGQPVPSLP